MTPKKTRKSGCRGLTLLELLVATALAVFIVTAIAVLTGRSLTAWGRTNDRLQQLFLMEKGLNQLGEDLRNGVAVGSQEKPFVGTKEQLDFFLGQDSTHLVKVVYKLLPKGPTWEWVRESQPMVSAEKGNVQTKTLALQVTAFVVKYGATNPDRAGRIQWVETWDTPKQLPQLLRVQIQMKEAQGGMGSISREFLIPQGVLARPPERKA